MATMGLVFIPGMITGQLLSGASPITAIKYQLAIMLGIFSVGTQSVSTAILFSLRWCFDEYEVLRQDVLVEKALS